MISSLGEKRIEFDGVPFTIGEKRDLHCQFGSHYYPLKCDNNKTCTQRENKEQSGNADKGKDNGEERIILQGTCKIGSPSVTLIREYTLFPKYRMAYHSQNNWQLRKSRETMLNHLKETLRSQTPIKRVVKYFVSLPVEEVITKFTRQEESMQCDGVLRSMNWLHQD